MTQIKKIGLLDINESMEFMKLKEEFSKFMEKIAAAGGEQAIYNTIKSKPFSAAILLNETEKMMRKISDAHSGYAKRDMYVAKELNQMNAKLATFRENIKTR
ncbi:MAG: hypothetical protein WC475_03060 [Candidatus Paceibacterota bacterium]